MQFAAKLTAIATGANSSAENFTCQNNGVCERYEIAASS